jgi:predicted  nucleic acid-binding Zn-ribbon protein
MKNYQCKKCSTLLQGNSQPSTSGCPAGSFHQWTDLGQTGDKNYQCKKCGTLVHSGNQPSTSGCPEGSFHQWTKL